MGSIRIHVVRLVGTGLGMGYESVSGYSGWNFLGKDVLVYLV